MKNKVMVFKETKTCVHVEIKNNFRNFLIVSFCRQDGVVEVSLIFWSFKCV